MADFFVQVAEDIISLFQAKHMVYDFASEQAKVNSNPSKVDRIRYEERMLALLNYVDRIVNPIPRKVVFSETLSKYNGPKISNHACTKHREHDIL